MICGDFKLEELKEEKFLGDYQAGGLKESVMVRIQRIYSKTRRASYEILNIIKDYREQLIGGFQTGLVLWESCIIPSRLTYILGQHMITWLACHCMVTYFSLVHVIILVTFFTNIKK